MPASLPGSTLAENLANPSEGLPVIFDLLSGPKGSLLDNDQAGNASTGALCTGIGFGPNNVMDMVPPNFTDDYLVGDSLQGTSAGASILMYIGGGVSEPNIGGEALENPYLQGYGIGSAGNGGSRDAGAGPAFTGFETKSVTAIADIANGAEVTAGWTNRSGVTIKAGQSVFASSTAASLVPA